MTIKNIAIYGSCVSKDPFTTLFNKDYKERYKCIINDQKHSFISTMQNKEDYIDSEITIFPTDVGDNHYTSKCIKEDFEKTFIDSMLNNKIDYLIFDVNFEVQWGVLCFENNKYITNIPGFRKTKCYQNLENAYPINMIHNPHKFFELWKIYCNKFFNFLKKYCPETKVILIEVRALDVVQRDDLSTYIEPLFTQKAKISNIYYKQLEDYIKHNFDVSVVKFSKDTVLKKNHHWGTFFVHYDDEFYTNVVKEVDKIVEIDELKKKVENLSIENEKLKSLINKD